MQFSLRFKKIFYVFEYFMLRMYKNKIIFTKEKTILNGSISYLQSSSYFFLVMILNLPNIKLDQIKLILYLYISKTFNNNHIK